MITFLALHIFIALIISDIIYPYPSDPILELKCDNSQVIDTGYISIPLDVRNIEYREDRHQKQNNACFIRDETRISTMGHNHVLNIGGNEYPSISICGWLKIDDNPGGSRMNIIDFGGYEDLQYHGGYYVQLVNRQIVFGISSPYEEYWSVSVVDFYNWYFFCAVYNNYEILIYLNAINKGYVAVDKWEAIGSGRLHTYNDDQPLKIGSTKRNPFRGYLDDIRVYNRALMNEEVSNLYFDYHDHRPDWEEYYHDGNTSTHVPCESCWLIFLLIGISLFFFCCGVFCTFIILYLGLKYGKKEKEEGSEENEIPYNVIRNNDDEFIEDETEMNIKKEILEEEKEEKQKMKEEEINLKEEKANDEENI